MERKDRRRDNWSEDEERERRADCEAAQRYGFTPEDIAKARGDLVALLVAYRDNSVSKYEDAARDMKRVVANLDKRVGELNELATETNVADIGHAAADLGAVIDRLSAIRERLPRRPHSIQRIAVTYLMAFWTHEPRRAENLSSRDIVVSFNGEKPLHPSMRFIMEMLARSGDALLADIKRTTIDRAYKEIRGSIPHPGQVYAFEGDPDYIH